MCYRQAGIEGILIMARKQEKSVEQYEHTGAKRVNNPPVGLVTPQTDPDRGTVKGYVSERT